MSESNVGFIGLGKLGLPIATNLLAAGHALRVYNRTTEKAAPLAARGATVASRPADAVSAGDVVVTLVWDDQAVLDVVSSDGFLESLGAGGVHVGMSTIHPDTARRLAAMHARAGSMYVAAPIFGPPASAEAKALLIPMSGPAAGKARIRALLDQMGAKDVVDLGEDVGTATLAKLLGNFLILTSARALGEALDVADKVGIDRAPLVDLLTNALLPAPPLQRFGKHFAAGGGPVRGGIAIKDLGLLGSFAEQHGVRTPVAHLVRELVQ